MPISKTLKKKLKKANDDNGVILIDINKTTVDDPEKIPTWFAEMGYMQDAAEEDPRFMWKDLDCHLCGTSIDYMDYEEVFLVCNDKLYTLLNTAFLDYLNDECEETEGYLRCVYCFNAYHHRPCVFTMSKSTYISHKVNKTWSCPTCTPPFVPKKPKPSLPLASSYDKDMMIELFKTLFYYSSKCTYNELKLFFNFASCYVPIHYNLTGVG